MTGEREQGSSRLQMVYGPAATRPVARRHRRSWYALLLATSVLSCSQTTGLSVDGGETLAYVAGSTIRAIDLESGETSWTMPLGGAIEGVVRGTAPDELLVVVEHDDFVRELVSVDLCTRLIEPRFVFRGPDGPNLLNGIQLSTGEVMAVRHPDLGDGIYLWRARKNDTLGIVSLDLPSVTPTAFSGPWNVAAGGIVPLWPGGVNEALAVAASREQDGPRRDEKVYLLDPGSLEIRDSITMADLGVGPDVWTVAALNDGRTLLVSGEARVVRYDLRLKRAVTSIARPARGGPHLSPDNGTIVFTDQVAGLIQEYDEDLSPLGTINVSSAVTGVLTFAPDGRRAYILAGTPPEGPRPSSSSVQSQPVQIVAVDLEARSVLRVYELGGHDLGWPFLFGCD